MTELSGDLTVSFPKFLREKALEEIGSRNLSRDELAKTLQLFPAGVDRIMSQTTWSAELGCRVLQALDISISVEPVDNRDTSSSS